MTNRRFFDKIQIIILLISFSLLILHISSPDIYLLKFEGFSIVLLSFLLLERYWNSWPLRIIGLIILWCNYSIVVVNIYLLPDSFFVKYALEKDPSYMSSVFYLHLFIFSLVLFSSKSKIYTYLITDIVGKRSSIKICFGIFIMLIIIFKFFFVRPANIGERGTPTTIYEYSIMLFLLAYYYSPSKKISIFIDVLLFIFALQNLLYSGRITALQLFICWFLCRISNKATMINILPFVVIGFFLFSIIGNFRSSDMSSQFSLSLASNMVKNEGYSLDTAYSAFHTSITFLKYHDMVSIVDRIVDFFLFALSMIFGGTLVPNSNLAQITREYFFHWYGGILPFFFYYYLGFFGVVCIAFYLSRLMKLVPDTDFKKLLIIYLSCSSFRWYLYSPSNLFRGIFLFWVLFTFLDRFANSEEEIRNIQCIPKNVME